MTAFKQLLASDIIVTPFEVNKAFRFTGAAELTGSTVGIDRFLGQNIQGLFSLNEATTGQITTEYKRLIYNSAKELYYSNYLSSSYGDPVAVPFIFPGSNEDGDVLVGSISSAGRYENYLETTLTLDANETSGSINLKLKAKTIYLNNSNGTPDIELSGSCDFFKISIIANGTFSAKNLFVKDSIYLQYASSLYSELQSTNCKLKAELSGVGNVGYFGVPSLILTNYYNSGRLIDKN